MRDLPLPQPLSPAEKFICALEHAFHIDWWTSLRLRDCGELVYKHAVKDCPCGRLQSAAYDAWRAENPELAAEADRLTRERAKL